MAGADNNRTDETQSAPGDGAPSTQDSHLVPAQFEAASEQTQSKAAGEFDAVSSDGSHSDASYTATPNGDVDTRAPDQPVVSHDLAHWLTGELKPSPSKSVPPSPSEPPPGVVATPETLAPQVMPPDELDEEDLAVLPMARRRKRGNWAQKAGMAGLGALLALLVFGYRWWNAAHDVQPAVGAANGSWQEAREPGARGAASPAAPTPETANTLATSADEPKKRRIPAGAWAAPAAAPETEVPAPEPAFPGGPSVARFPDLPAAVWSYLRQTEAQAKKAGSSIVEPEPTEAPTAP